MVSNKRSTIATSAQRAGIPGRSQSSLDWNAPQEPSTPRGEYAFMMEDCSPVWGIQSHGSFGPFNGGMAVCQ